MLPVLRRFAGFVVASLWLAGCRPTVHFETSVDGQAKVPGGGVLGAVFALPGLSGFSQIDFNQSQEFKNRGVQKKDVQNVDLLSFRLKIASPANADFKWLQTIRFYAEADGRRELIAEKTNISSLNLPGPNPSLDLDLKATDLLPYITAASMSITSEGTGSPPPSETTIDATVRVAVDAYIIR